MLPILIVATSILYIWLIPNQPASVKLLFKLIPMWLMIAYAWLRRPAEPRRYGICVLIGLFFCMLGDGLLGVSFVVGLSAFLVGHLFYIAGFLSAWRFSFAKAVMLLPIAAYGFLVGRELLAALVQNGQTPLLVPVVLYVLVISFMAWASIMTGRGWAAFGALLFVASDSILAWNKFVSDVAYSGPLIMTTYYAAQFLIASSFPAKTPQPRTAETNHSA
ncbi:lysoplasmalogenase [Paenibacillus ginsengarvi]|uniref:lysoplasmalogenase n=1 Tax=Paenibacillus ginsengarvi TaxID=400777 RepID=UPI001F0171F6|nr:lysoplasmalogenase [Paenibacillus ginsengarvi]